MRMLMYGLSLSLALIANDVKAQNKVTVEGTEYDISVLMGNCQSMSGTPEAQLACFASLSQLLEQQNGEGQDSGPTVPEALEAFRSVAQYQDNDTGLAIAGSDCRIRIVYFNNYFYLSRRNVSSIDLFSAQFDASRIQHDQIVEVRGAQAPLFKGQMETGATAMLQGGVAMESKDHSFEPKSARMAMYDYANEVVSQLPTSENPTFDFVLVHPKRNNARDDILRAFETFVKACKR